MVDQNPICLSFLSLKLMKMPRQDHHKCIIVQIIKFNVILHGRYSVTTGTKIKQELIRLVHDKRIA